MGWNIDGHVENDLLGVIMLSTRENLIAHCISVYIILPWCDEKLLQFVKIEFAYLVLGFFELLSLCCTNIEFNSNCRFLNNGSLYICSSHVWEFWLVEKSWLSQSAFCWELEWDASLAYHGSKYLLQFNGCMFLLLISVSGTFCLLCFLCWLWSAVMVSSPVNVVSLFQFVIYCMGWHLNTRWSVNLI